MITKYDIGDRVYMIHEKTEFIESICKHCDGTGFFNSPNNLYQQRCGNCNGRGKCFEEDNPTYTVTRDMNNIDEMTIDADGVFYEEIGGYGAVEKDCFLTQEEAQKECDRRNGVA